MLPGMSDKRDPAQPPTEQGGLPNEYAPRTGTPVEQGRPEEGLDDGSLLISGVNTGPRREERDSRSPTEERARLSIRTEEHEPELSTEADPAALIDRGD